MGGCEGTGWLGTKVCADRFKTTIRLMPASANSAHAFFDFINIFIRLLDLSATPIFFWPPVP
jgi:hypothetical protein